MVTRRIKLKKIQSVAFICPNEIPLSPKYSKCLHHFDDNIRKCHFLQINVHNNLILVGIIQIQLTAIKILTARPIMFPSISVHRNIAKSVTEIVMKIKLNSLS